jgi:hypothetical protein
MKVFCLFKLFVISGLISSNLHSQANASQGKYSVTNNKSAEEIIYKAARRPARTNIKYKCVAKIAIRRFVVEKTM